MQPDKDGTLVVPAEITTIDPNAFSSSSELKHLVLHKGVTSIGEYAFAHCRSLISVDMKGANTDIAKSAFFKCTNLQNCFNALFVNDIGAWAFFECSELKSIVCSAAHVGMRAFDSCTSLQRFESSVEWKPDSYAFFRCKSLLALRGMTYLPLGCCSRCKNLRTVDPAAGILIVGELAFSGAKNLRTISLPSATKVNRGAFYECSGLKEIVLPNGETIGKSAFGRCLFLQRIDMPKVHTLKEKAFQLCHALASVELPALEVAEDYVFEFCLNLTTVTLLRLYTLGHSAFRGDSRLETLTIPNVQRLRKLTCFSCVNLHTVLCGSTLDVGESCFSRCESLVTVPDMPRASVFRTKCFEGSGLQSIQISTRTILDYAFSGCTALRRVVLLPGVHTVGSMAFRFCPVTEIVYPDTVLVVGDFNASSCPKLKTIVMAEHVPEGQRRVIMPYGFVRCKAVIISGPTKIFRQLKITPKRLPKLQLYHYFWSMARHKEGSLGAKVARVVWTVYAIFERLNMPQEMAMLVLTMSAVSHLGAPPVVERIPWGPAAL